MNALDHIKNSLIDRILVTQNEKLLEAISNIFESTQTEDVVNLTSEQIEMLEMSEQDIAQGKYISEDDLYKSDNEWLG
ncbi:hypothetical protein [Flavobacterium selenitireducens]|uniref:hypothetical protein n=1 Tax=Flavobacterium selenitireducens TaxID=2722704 RepID=UPI00168A7D2F|nr:hypothetical protein [Flavobacterium selenitireducens]MBD3583915.1 hypothetical protein [Flavobacterium selenitireducens]